MPPATIPGQPSRIESARGRAAAVRRGAVWAAVAAFGGGLLVVRASHPAAAHTSARALAAPASLVAQIQGSAIGGGSISSASGPTAASTSTS
jgi:hypothetical protein